MLMSSLKTCWLLKPVVYFKIVLVPPPPPGHPLELPLIRTVCRARMYRRRSSPSPHLCKMLLTWTEELHNLQEESWTFDKQSAVHLWLLWWLPCNYPLPLRGLQLHGDGIEHLHLCAEEVNQVKISVTTIIWCWRRKWLDNVRNSLVGLPTEWRIIYYWIFPFQ